MLFTFMIWRLKKKKRINISSSDDVISNEKYTETAANNCLTEKKIALIIYFIKCRIPNARKLLLVLNFVVILPDKFNDALAKFLRAESEDVQLIRVFFSLSLSTASWPGRLWEKVPELFPFSAPQDFLG